MAQKPTSVLKYLEQRSGKLPNNCAREFLREPTQRRI